MVTVSTCIISEAFYDSLAKALRYDELDITVKNEYKAISRIFYENERRIFNLLKQELRMFDYQYFTGNPDEWSLDGNCWQVIPWGQLRMILWSDPINALNAEWRRKVELLLSEGEEPLLAIQHLHEAKRSREDRFRWIEATIAAELAIKEILVRLEPKYEIIFLYLPSPL